MESIQDSQTIPLEYQVFAIALRVNGGLKYFAENLPPEIVGLNSGNIGIHEFYLSLLSYYNATSCDHVDPVAFKIWLEKNSDVFSALGETGIAKILNVISNIEITDMESITALLQYQDRTLGQIKRLDEIDYLLKKKDKSKEDSAKIDKLAAEIKELEIFSSEDPYEKAVTASQMQDHIEDILDIPTFLSTQFKQLNIALGYDHNGGFFRGAVHAILAQSGRGKSTFAKVLVNHWLDEGHKVLYLNYEEAPAHWNRILMTQIIGKNVYKEANHWSEKEKAAHIQVFREKLEQWGDNLVVRHDPDSPYFEDMERWIKEISKSDARLPDVIVIDTLQSMFTRGAGKPRWGEFEEMMVRLERMAKDLNCVLIITAQENANRMKEKRDVVMQSDTGGSITIQQKSSVTMFLTQRKTVVDDETQDDSIMQIQIPKNRITGSTFLYNPPLIKYLDDSKSYVEYQVDMDEVANEGSMSDTFNRILNGSFQL